MLLAFHKPYGVISQFTPDGAPGVGAGSGYFIVRVVAGNHGETGAQTPPLVRP